MIFTKMHKFNCISCEDEFSKVRLRGQTELCPKCLSNQRVTNWKKKNPDRVKENNSVWNNSDGKRISQKKYTDKLMQTEEGRQKLCEKSKRYAAKLTKEQRSEIYYRNQDANIQKVINRQKHVKQATPAWADMDKIAEIYIKCRRLTEDTGIVYNVDHIIPLRGKNVCGLHVYENLQIITKSQNSTKGNKFINKDY